METKFKILAAHHPFKGFYEEFFNCNTLWSALKKFREFRHAGYEIIDVRYRDIKETFTWAFSEDE